MENETIADLTESRDHWHGEWRLLNAANIQAEERIKELEEERDGYRDGQQQVQDVLNTVMEENRKLRAALHALKGEEANHEPT